MRVVVWGINYAPEPTGIGPFNTDMARYLAERGHEVIAVPAFRYYPEWRKQPEDAGRWSRREMIDGVRVERCWCHVPSRVTTLHRIFHEFSYVSTSFLRVLTLPRPDVLIVVSPPLALGAAAWVASRLRRAPFVFHVQDLQPDAAVGLGMMKVGWLTRVLYRLEALAYRKATIVSGISAGMMAAFERKGVSAARRLLFANWLRGAAPGLPTPAQRALARARFHVPPDTLLAVYAGNIGRKQNLEIVCEAARQVAATSGSTPPIRILIAGNGAGRADLESSLRDRPAANVELLPILDDDAYRDLLFGADVSLITQVPGSGQFFFPSKLLTTLQHGLPVIAVADDDSELALAVTEGGFGRVVSPSTPEPLARELLQLAHTPSTLDAWRTATRWVDRFQRSTLLGAFEEKLRAVTGK